MKQGWEVKALGELIEKLETFDPTKQPDLRFKYVDVSGVCNRTFAITKFTEMKGSEAPSRARRKIRTDDVIFATVRPTLKRVAIIPEHLNGEICSTGYMVLRPVEGLLSGYLFYYLLSDEFINEMKTLQSGTSYPAITDTQLKEHCIPLPPLDEQKRIVAVLGEAFEGLETARANAEANLVGLSTLRQSFLQRAFEGELT